VLVALHHRVANGGEGQVVDVALYEAVFNVMESLLPEYDAFGTVRERAGSALPGIAPTNAYPCSDGQYVVVGGNGDSIFKRLMLAIGRPDLEADPALAHNDGRVKRADELDAAIAAWTLHRSRDEALAVLDAARVPAGKIYSVADIAADPQYAARGMIVDTPTSDGRPLKAPGIVPKLSATPGAIAHAAPALGQHDADLARPGGGGWPVRAD
jgi:formyl-CoA transferase